MPVSLHVSTSLTRKSFPEVSSSTVNDIVNYIVNDTFLHLMPRHVPPSVIRYDKENPIVSVRLTKSLKESLDKIREEEGMSYAELIAQALAFADEVVDADKAYQQGWDEAKAEFAIKVPCAVCGKSMVVKANTKTHKALTDLLKAKRWSHAACVKRSD